MYIKLVNGVPETYSAAQLRADNPQTSFPVELSDATLAEFDVYPLLPAPLPTVDPATQTLAEAPARLIEGQWTQQWEVQQATAQEIEQRAAAQAAEVRAQRNALLSQTDWTQCKDIPDAVSASWAAYRQLLRDVPSQADFPWAVTWPQPPQ